MFKLTQKIKAIRMALLQSGGGNARSLWPFLKRNAKRNHPINYSLKDEILLELNLMNSLHRRIFTGINGQKSLSFRRVIEIRSFFM